MLPENKPGEETRAIKQEIDKKISKIQSLIDRVVNYSNEENLAVADKHTIHSKTITLQQSLNLFTDIKNNWFDLVHKNADLMSRDDKTSMASLAFQITSRYESMQNITIELNQALLKTGENKGDNTLNSPST